MFKSLSKLSNCAGECNSEKFKLVLCRKGRERVNVHNSQVTLKVLGGLYPAELESKGNHKVVNLGHLPGGKLARLRHQGQRLS